MDRGNDLVETGAQAGKWIGDRASDVHSAATAAADAAGKWFGNRAEDICEITTYAVCWGGERIGELQVVMSDTGERIGYLISNADLSKWTQKEYYLESGEKLLLGEYSDKDPTALSLGLNLAASLANADVGMDIRDLVYDVQNYGTDNVKLSGLALDAVALLPVIGVIKYAKHADTIVDSVKAASKVMDATSDIAKNADNAVDLLDTVHDASKAADAADTIKDTAKAADAVDDVVDAGKAISKTPFNELPEGVQETFKKYSDCDWDGTKALENMTPGTNAGRVFENRDLDLPEVDDMGRKLSYTEYDAYQFGKDPEFPHLPDHMKRGKNRFVRDNLGNTYFTDDHYLTYTLIESVVG